MMRFLDVLNWRDVASVSCAWWAGVLGDQAVNVVGQNSGLTAGNQSHGEVTAIDQSPDHTRGDPGAPAIFAASFSCLLGGLNLPSQLRERQGCQVNCGGCDF